MVRDPLFLVTRLNNSQLLIEQGVLNVGTDFTSESSWHYIDWLKMQDERLLEIVPLNKRDLICFIQSTEIICMNISTNKRLCSLSFESPICHYCYYEYLPSCFLLAVKTLENFRVYKLVYEGNQPYFQTMYELQHDLVTGLGKISAMTMCPEFLAICTCAYPRGKRSALTTINVFRISEGDWTSTEGKVQNGTSITPNFFATTDFQIQGRPKTLQFDRASQLIVVLKRGETYYFFRYKFSSAITENGTPIIRGDLLSEPSSGMQYQFRSCISKHSILYAGRYPNYVCIECRRNPRSFTFAAHCSFASEHEFVGVANTPNGSFVAAVDPNRTHIDLYYNFCFCTSMQLVGKNGPIPKGSKLLGCCILPESYYLLAYTTNGLMALYCIQNSSYGLFQVNRTYTLPLASYAIERTRRSLLILYDTHYLYLYMNSVDDNMDSLVSSMAWCPNPMHVSVYQKIFAEDRGPMEITGFTTGTAGNKSIINVTLRFKNDESFVVTLDLQQGEFAPGCLTAAIASTTARIESAGAQTAIRHVSPIHEIKADSVSNEETNPDPHMALNAEVSKVQSDDDQDVVASVLSSIPSADHHIAGNMEIQAA